METMDSQWKQWIHIGDPLKTLGTPTENSFPVHREGRFHFKKGGRHNMVTTIYQISFEPGFGAYQGVA